MKSVLVSGSFDNLGCRHVRLLHEASRLGEVRVVLWSDAAVESRTGRPPKFPLEERRYLVEAIRFVGSVCVDAGAGDTLPRLPEGTPDIWAMGEGEDSPARRAACAEAGIVPRVFSAGDLAGYPSILPVPVPGEKKVIVTGCYDWLHSGHVRFFEEVSLLGGVVVVVGSDANVALLKGKGHPMFSEEERRYMAGSIRFVREALVSTGSGWVDAAPEVERVRPEIYAVNEDGDRPEKREFCRLRGIEYVVLKRTPREGLAGRSSTGLRGF